MIQDKIQTAIEALQALLDALGIENPRQNPRGRTVFSGNTVRLVEESGVVRQVKTRKKKQPRRVMAKRRRGQDWPKTIGGNRNAISTPVSKVLYEILKKKPNGILRKDLYGLMKQRLPMTVQTPENNTGRKKWFDCLSNILRNYEIAGYVKKQPGDHRGRRGHMTHEDRFSLKG